MWATVSRCYSGRSLQKMANAARNTNEERVLPSEFTVQGIFNVGFPEYNRTHVVASLEDAGRSWTCRRTG